MSEHDTDSFYWEPDPDFPLKQGDLLLNVPLALMPSQPEFVVRPPGAGEAEIVPTDGFPEVAPTTEIVAEARFGALSMIITPHLPRLRGGEGRGRRRSRSSGTPPGRRPQPG
jgi:hypothetical protein